MLIFVLMLVCTSLCKINAIETTFASHDHYDEFLRTETAVLDILRDYVENFETKLSLIKRKTLEMKALYTVALNDVDKYVSNPFNALAVLKRFAIDWSTLQKMANNLLNNTDEMAKDKNAMTSSLKFPSEDDFDEAVGNLLRLQDVYKLAPQRISLGQMNGVKFGPEMSWSDCLEIGRKSNENGYFKIAKFWIETAMDKVSAIDSTPTELNANKTSTHFTVTNNKAQNVEVSNAKFEILETLLNTEFQMGNYEKALEITDEILALSPRHKGILKDKETIRNALKKESKKARNKRLKKSQKNEKRKKEVKKSTEIILIEDICRAATIAPHGAISDINPNKCHLEYGNLNELKMSPIKLEVLSKDPFIVLHHDILSSKQIDDLKELIQETSLNNDDEEHEVQIEFTNLGKQKLRNFSKKLQRQTGHASDVFEDWQLQKHTYELSDIEQTATLSTTKQQETSANVLLNLQMAKMGGSIVFPQLELSFQMPSGALLYWSNLNEFQEVDYRSKHHVCPVIAGTQITTTSRIRRA